MVGSPCSDDTEAPAGAEDVGAAVLSEAAGAVDGGAGVVEPVVEGLVLDGVPDGVADAVSRGVPVAVSVGAVSVGSGLVETDATLRDDWADALEPGDGDGSCDADATGARDAAPETRPTVTSRRITARNVQPPRSGRPGTALPPLWHTNN